MAMVTIGSDQLPQSTLLGPVGQPLLGNCTYVVISYNKPVTLHVHKLFEPYYSIKLELAAKC